MKWTKTGRSEYTSDNGRWRITRNLIGRWDVVLQLPGKKREHWGEWKYRDQSGQGHGYKPFSTLLDAQAMVDEYHHGGFDVADGEIGT